MSVARWILGRSPDFKVEENWIQVDGHAMHYLKAGEGPALLVLHGLLGAVACWVPSLEVLAGGSTVYAVDGLCIGKSDRVPHLAADLASTAERLVQFMDAVGLRRADFLATSHGGAVALMLAALHPERVRSLTLHAPANPFSDIADPLIQFYRTRLGRWFAQQVPTLPPRLQNLALARMYGDPTLIREGALENYVSSLGIPGSVEHVLRILHCWSADMKKLKQMLGRIPDIPTLLLWGTRDRAVSLDSGFILAKVLGDAELVILPGAGHLPYEEDPLMFTRPINRFLRQIDRSLRTTALPGPKLVSGKASERGVA